MRHLDRRGILSGRFLFRMLGSNRGLVGPIISSHLGPTKTSFMLMTNQPMAEEKDLINLRAGRWGDDELPLSHSTRITTYTLGAWITRSSKEYRSCWPCPRWPTTPTTTDVITPFFVLFFVWLPLFTAIVIIALPLFLTFSVHIEEVT